jgi:hypothetical protein
VLLPSHAVPIPTANTAAWVRMRLERFMEWGEEIRDQREWNFKN